MALYRPCVFSIRMRPNMPTPAMPTKPSLKPVVTSIDPPPPTPSKPRAEASSLLHVSSFEERHIGPSAQERDAMLATLDVSSLDELSEQIVPAAIRLGHELDLPSAQSESQATAALQELADDNQVFRSMIGMGYHGTLTPAVIRRSIIENPQWYTPYTPYQAEISQGRLEALLNFQTMIADLTGLPLAGASLLDEATAAAEAMAMCYAIGRGKRGMFFASDRCHPQTLSVLATRAKGIGVDLHVGPLSDVVYDERLAGVLVQYPATDGAIKDHRELAEKAHEAGALVVAATDLLACCLIEAPGEWGADIAVGSAQRFGVPMGYGGPHAAFMSTRDQYARKMPGRLIGVSRDAHGQRALRLTLQTREQHIKRDRATSNICTAQVLLAIIASMYAVYHGPRGLRSIAQDVHQKANTLAACLNKLGYEVEHAKFFDTVVVKSNSADALVEAAAKRKINLRRMDGQAVGITVDESTTERDLLGVLLAFSQDGGAGIDASQLEALIKSSANTPVASVLPTRSSEYLTHDVFNRYHAEHEFLRYTQRLIGKDIGLDRSMIPLGSCTMKLNAAAEMLPITWPGFAGLHPYAPTSQAKGYHKLFDDLERWLGEVTGLPAVSLQPNAGSQGEYAGLLAIRGYHDANNQADRDVCLIPTSAHGTNPASAVIAGMRVVGVGCDEQGNIDLQDLRDKAAKHAECLAAAMITYPSTHGVYETGVVEACAIVHEHGGLVYMDGANMNAQVGLTSPAQIGADVCHLTLHKTFCIPHGGGGPGMGPIAATEALRPFLPSDPIGGGGVGPVSAAPFGSPMILPIPWMYIAMMGPGGLKRATQVAMLNANYMAARLSDHYDVLYTGMHGRVAHEFILDCRPFEKSAGVTVEDIAKRLIDFGFHAPTMSWPVPGTLMIEPTESESKAELDRFCDAMIAIRQEIEQIESGALDEQDNPLKNAPHTAEQLTADDWPHNYPRSQAAYPADWVRERKYWPPVSRVDNAHGDRNLVCTCPSVEDLAEAQ